MQEKTANSTGGVAFDVYLQRNDAQRLINETASFSHALGASKGEIVVLDHFSILENERFRGYGPAALRHILKLYKRSGCLVIEVPAPNTDGTRCYEKCGMDRKLGLNLRVVCAESNFEPTASSLAKHKKRHDPRGAAKRLCTTRQDTTPEEQQVRGIGGINHLSPVRCNLVNTLEEWEDDGSPPATPLQDDDKESDPELGDSDDDEDFNPLVDDQQVEVTSNSDPEQTPTSNLPGSNNNTPRKLLDDLLRGTKRGHQVGAQDEAKEKRSVERRSKHQPGIGQKCGKLFDLVLTRVSKAFNLNHYPLTLPVVAKHMEGGGQLVKDAETKQAACKQSEILAQSALELVKKVGPACKEAAVGIFAAGNSEGKLPTAKLADLTGLSRRYIQKARVSVQEGKVSAFSSLKRSGDRYIQLCCPSRLDPCGLCEFGEECKHLHDCQCCRDGSQCAASQCPKWNPALAKRNNERRMQRAKLMTRTHVGDAECESTRAWFRELNPARSGDKQDICWMINTLDDFYHEKYRSVEGQSEIILLALEYFGDDIRHAAKQPTNRFLRNVKAYLDAAADGVLDQLKVQEDVAPDAALDSVLDSVLDDTERQINLDAAVNQSANELCIETHYQAAHEQEEMEQDEDDNHADVRTLCPRTSRFLYQTLLKGMRLWHRPPHNHCERCASYDKTAARIAELTAALTSVCTHPGYESNSKIVEAAGGEAKAWEELRALQIALPDLKKHVDWFNEVRAFLKAREAGLEVHEALLQLDYGGFTDSVNKKVSCWSASVIVQGRLVEHFDFFFDQAPKKEKDNGKGDPSKARKDGQSGIFFLHELLDPKRSPDGDGVSIFSSVFPHVKHLILSGDTGNGYRAYEMLEHLSEAFNSMGFSVELSPLSPGHAWNRTDGRLAHMNTFLKVLKAKSRVFGAEGIARAFWAASNRALTTKRKFIERSHVYFRVVKTDKAKAAAMKKLLGAQLKSEWVDKGHMGVRGLLYFDFSVLDADGNKFHLAGYARVRQHPDPDRPGNKTFVYTWRRDLINLMCQPCSNRRGGPVSLRVSGCTKQTCAVDKQEQQQHKDSVRSRPSQPLQRPSMSEEEDAVQEEPAACEEDSAGTRDSRKGIRASASARARAKSTCLEIRTTEEVRIVRAVHGMSNGKQELWLYVPEQANDKSNAQRKGWWLHPQPGKHRYYYIGPLENIQGSKTLKLPDVAIFANFPFTSTVQLKNGAPVKGTLRVVTNRTLTESELKEANKGVDIPEPTVAEEGGVGGNEEDEDEEEEEEEEEDEEEEEKTRSTRRVTRASRRT